MSKDRNAAVQSISTLLPKLGDPDPDIRFMQLNDLANILNGSGSEYLKNDNHTAARLIDAILKVLSDSNGEVQNKALNCIGPLAARIPNDYVAPLLDKITDLTNNTEIDISVPNTALRTLVASLPRPQSGASDKDTKYAYSGVSRVLIPRLIGRPVLSNPKPSSQMPAGLLQQQKDKSYNSDAVDVLIEVIRCYGAILQEAELVALAKAVMHIIESPQAGGVVKKRALAGVGVIAVHFNDAQLTSFLESLVQSFQKPRLSYNHRRFLISTIGTLAHSIPKKFGPFVNELAPYVLSALSQEELEEHTVEDDVEVDAELEELREAALVTVESLLSSCPTEMQPSLKIVVETTLRYVKYDPNVAELDDEEMGGTQEEDSDDGITEEPLDDEDDEYAELDDEDALSDIDDTSWKVRRCAAKSLQTIISGASPTDHATLFSQITPVLITRLNNEREDSVRLEVISAVTILVQKTGTTVNNRPAVDSNGTLGSSASLINTRKRRRQDSESAMHDKDLKGLVLSRSSPPIEASAPPTGPGADLALVIPKLVQAVTTMWKKAGMALKQSAVILLKMMAMSRNGALADHLQQLEDPIADALKPSSTGSSGSTSGSTATVASLQIETLSLISTITETNGNRVLIPFVIALIPSVTSTVRDRNYKVAVETLATIEQFVKALTPPRLPETNQDHAIHIENLYNVVLNPVTDINTDLEIRHRAIQVFGVLIARTSGTGLLQQSARTKALGVLNDRLKNETTRLETARAIGLIAESARAQDNIGSDWVQDVALEMANQLRKVDRVLRGSCLEALQYIALNVVTASQLEPTTIQQLQGLLMPLITPEDLHLLTPALVVVAKLIPADPKALVTAEMIKALCLLTRTRLEGPPIKAYLLVLKVIGEQKVGEPVMKGLLAIGTDGDTMVLGRAVGTLMVFGGGNIGVSVPDFAKEVSSAPDLRARCLALTVLGEVGFRMGASSPLGLDIFINSLESESERIRLAAAVALGSASSSNINIAMPIILRGLSGSDSQAYLYLHALKEILQHSESAGVDLAPYASELWQRLFTVCNVEDNRAVGAECIGRLALIEPNTYMPELSKSLESSDEIVRGTVISAFRFTLADTGATFNAMLSVIITSLLKKMLADANLSNRRTAVTALNAAIHNKPSLVIPDISQFLPMVLADSHIKPELIKTIQIGPFKHQEDSGLDLRKSAYATMYTLLDTPKAIRLLPIPTIFDRILDGIPDDHDIRTLCNMMLSRLSNIAPLETRRRLSALAEKFKIVLGTKIKENAVKQEIEKVNEANAAVLRISLELDKAFPNAGSDGTAEMVGWKQYLEYVKKGFAAMVRSVMNEQ